MPIDGAGLPARVIRPRLARRGGRPAGGGGDGSAAGHAGRVCGTDAHGTGHLG